MTYNHYHLSNFYCTNEHVLYIEENTKKYFRIFPVSLDLKYVTQGKYIRQGKFIKKGSWHL